MGETEPLQVTIELPAKDFMEYQGGMLVRCPLNGVWVELTDYYSENSGQLLPLVGKVNYKESTHHWLTMGEVDEYGIASMKRVEKEAPVEWNETVRVLSKADELPPEGGALSMHVSENVGTTEKFG